MLKRHVICVKGRTGQNRLIPLTSINPGNSRYQDKAYRAKGWKDDEKGLTVKAVMSLPNITGQKKDSSYKTVLEFFKALPIKPDYVKRYMHTRVHIKADLNQKS
ncbi:MAG: hypothetical protein LBP26_02750 [Clostridiales bacterium]|jgi:hypothetical protein|nr:hypothetical protein [Clostridiales bacterium]